LNENRSSHHQPAKPEPKAKIKKQLTADGRRHTPIKPERTAKQSFWFTPIRILSYSACIRLSRRLKRFEGIWNRRWTQIHADKTGKNNKIKILVLP